MLRLLSLWLCCCRSLSYFQRERPFHNNIFCISIGKVNESISMLNFPSNEADAALYAIATSKIERLLMAIFNVLGSFSSVKKSICWLHFFVSDITIWFYSIFDSAQPDQKEESMAQSQFWSINFTIVVFVSAWIAAIMGVCFTFTRLFRVRFYCHFVGKCEITMANNAKNALQGSCWVFRSHWNNESPVSWCNLSFWNGSRAKPCKYRPTIIEFDEFSIQRLKMWFRQ